MTLDIADRLRLALVSGETVQLADAERPISMEAAEALRDAAMLGIDGIRAWKLGATIHSVRETMALPHAFFGAVPANRVFENGAKVPVSLSNGPGVECEYGFRLSRDITAEDIAGKPDLSDLFDEILPCVEIPGTRFRDFGMYDGVGTVLDFGAIGTLVIGQGQPLGLDGLSEGIVQLVVDGQVAATGSGAVVDGGPAGPLLAFLKDAVTRGYRPRAGDVVVTGSCTGCIPVHPTAAITAHFGRLQSQATFTFIS